jgi:hypothetical protein
MSPLLQGIDAQHPLDTDRGAAIARLGIERTARSARTAPATRFISARNAARRVVLAWQSKPRCRQAGNSLRLRRTGVSHLRAASAERLRWADRAFARGLMLDFRIELGADQHHNYRQPHPGHKSDDSAE